LLSLSFFLSLSLSPSLLRICFLISFFHSIFTLFFNYFVLHSFFLRNSYHKMQVKFYVKYNNNNNNNNNNSMALFRERAISTERPRLVGEISADFCR
jgi:hypothetical protein